MAWGAMSVPAGGDFGLPGTVDASKRVQFLDKQGLHHMIPPLHHMVLWAVAPEAVTNAVCTCILPQTGHCCGYKHSCAARVFSQQTAATLVCAGDSLTGLIRYRSIKILLYTMLVGMAYSASWFSLFFSLYALWLPTTQQYSDSKAQRID